MNTDMANYLETWKKGEISPSPAAAYIGTRLIDFDDGRAEVGLTIEPHHLNSFGTVHGGILCSLADVAMGTAVVTTLTPGDNFSTANLDSRFCRPAMEGELLAKAGIIFRGRSTAHVECDVLSKGKLVARMSCTCMITPTGPSSQEKSRSGFPPSPKE